ncbi:hypothetical protein OHA37_27120 [Streptomyces sp. NBC_00335]|uniref:hypothetical protein n=1 Tax=unclassified Streptomyces TaxID=2593676 RepID=UPI0022569805|nr:MULTISPECIES: hypothetical protein [unclassified Streptomyces]MCX5407523.1 hypothetical protein [Streptomyces sp. NBC_00086]
MPELWMPGATRLDVGDHAPTDGGKPKAIAHITWDDNGTAAKPIDLVPYERLVDWFGRNPTGKKAAPHILWDPFTGRITQFLPADSRSKSLADSAGGTRTNRAGSIVIQVETLFFPYCRVNGTTYARLVDTPCKGWQQLLAWVRSWGVPDTWPMGRPTDFTARRSESVWANQGGWYAHAHVPENDHQDPGSWPAFATSEEDDMDATQAKQLAELHKATVPFMGWQYRGDGADRDAYGDLRTAAASAGDAAAKASQILAKIGTPQPVALTPEQVSAIADKLAASPTLAEQIAEKVTAKLATRLQS